MKTYNPAADSTIPTPGKKRKRSEENGESAPAPSIPDTPSTPATEEGLCTTTKKPFPSYFEPHYENEALCIVFIMKISFQSYANKTNFHMKSFTLS